MSWVTGSETSWFNSSGSAIDIASGVVISLSAKTDSSSGALVSGCDVPIPRIVVACLWTVGVISKVVMRRLGDPGPGEPRSDESTRDCDNRLPS